MTIAKPEEEIKRGNLTDKIKNGICIEDPRECPYTRGRAFLQKEERKRLSEELTDLEENTAFKSMHVARHQFTNDQYGHGYCPRCNIRYCTEPGDGVSKLQAECFSKVLAE